MKWTEHLVALLSAPFGSRTKKTNHFPKLPLELRYEIYSYLGLELYRLARTCPESANEIRSFISANISNIIPGFRSDNHSFNCALFVNHLDSLREVYPRLEAEKVSLHDITEFCHYKAITDANEKLRLSSVFLKKRLKLSLDPFDACGPTKYSFVFQRGLLLMAELLIATQKLSQTDYYRHSVLYSGYEYKDVFLKRALRFDDPISLLKLKFDDQYALMLYQTSTAEMKLEVIKLLALKENFESNTVSDQLVEALISDPEQLGRALQLSNEVAWTVRLWSKLSEAQRLSLNLPEDLSRRIYIICLKSFDLQEFSSKVPFSMEAVKLFPQLSLKEPCHFEAFKYLITHPEADFSEPSDWDSNMFRICSKSLVLKYWYLFLQHSQTFPPLRSGPETFLDGNDLSIHEIKALAPHMNLIDFLVLGNRAEMVSFLHPMKIPMYVTLNCFDIVPINNPIRSVLPAHLNFQHSWPLLHLAVILDNFSAYEAILSHSSFCPQVIDHSIDGVSIFDLFSLQQHTTRFKRILLERFGGPMNLPGYIEVE